MKASASLTIPVTVTSQAQNDAIMAIFLSALGSSDIAVDTFAAKATLRFQFPGNLDIVMGELYRRGLTNSATVALSVGVANPKGGPIDNHALVARLSELPAVSNVSYDSGVLSATVAAATGAMRSIQGEVVAVGLVTVDLPGRAPQQELLF